MDMVKSARWRRFPGVLAAVAAVLMAVLGMQAVHGDLGPSVQQDMTVVERVSADVLVVSDDFGYQRTIRGVADLQGSSAGSRISVWVPEGSSEAFLAPGTNNDWSWWYIPCFALGLWGLVNVFRYIGDIAADRDLEAMGLTPAPDDEPW